MTQTEIKVCTEYGKSILDLNPSGEQTFGFFTEGMSYSDHPTHVCYEDLVDKYQFCFAYAENDWIDWYSFQKKFSEYPRDEQVKINIIPNCGHMHPFQNPEAVNKLILEYYDKFENYNINGGKNTPLLKRTDRSQTSTIYDYFKSFVFKKSDAVSAPQKTTALSDGNRDDKSEDSIIDENIELELELDKKRTIYVAEDLEARKDAINFDILSKSDIMGSLKSPTYKKNYTLKSLKTPEKSIKKVKYSKKKVDESGEKTDKASFLMDSLELDETDSDENLGMIEEENLENYVANGKTRKRTNNMANKKKEIFEKFKGFQLDYGNSTTIVEKIERNWEDDQ